MGLLLFLWKQVIRRCAIGMKTVKMRDHYDFLEMKRRKNPYAKYLKQSVTVRLDRDTVAYFKAMSEEAGIPYQTLINLYLRDCASCRWSGQRSIADTKIPGIRYPHPLCWKKPAPNGTITGNHPRRTDQLSALN